MENKQLDQQPPSYNYQQPMDGGPYYQQAPQLPHQTVIIQQPQGAPQFSTGIRPGMQPYREWSSTLCACCDDMESCCLTAMCGYCYLAYLYQTYGECCCMAFFTPAPVTMLRVKHRSKHGVSGTMCNDLCTELWCGACALCQLKRDMNFVMSAGQGL